MKSLLYVTLACIPLLSIAQDHTADSLKIQEVVTVFLQSVEHKDSVNFVQLFFSDQVPFTGIMSKKTEWSIKEGYPDFQGIAVSDHKQFISEICSTDTSQREKISHFTSSNDGSIASVSFDYAYFSNANMIQWGHEKWNLVKVEEAWLITDVIYSIHFPDVEPFPSGNGH